MSLGQVLLASAGCHYRFCPSLLGRYTLSEWGDAYNQTSQFP